MSYSRLATKICLLSAALSSAVANAQNGTGTFTWQLSLDDGATWQSGVVDAPLSQQRVRVRALAAWEGPVTATGYAFANALFDATWTSQSAGGLSDAAGVLVRPEPFDQGQPQTLGASRFAQSIKIDDVRDTAPPGAGSRWVSCGQIAPGFGAPFSTANPVTIFTYTITLDATPGDRTAGAVFLEGSAPNRFMRVYLRTGDLNSPLMTHNTATLRVIPTPGVLAGLSIGMAVMAITARRRR